MTKPGLNLVFRGRSLTFARTSRVSRPSQAPSMFVWVFSVPVVALEQFGDVDVAVLKFM